MPLPRISLLLLACLAVCTGFSPLARAMELEQFESRHYQVHTNLEVEEAEPYAAHMDAMFGEFRRRFSEFEPRNEARMPLYLFRDHEDFAQFMRQRWGIDARNSDGMFFYQREGQGLATHVSGRNRTRTLQVLQHEGFHQFAFAYIGPQLPIWANEGLAQYFEDAVLVDGRLRHGLADADRIELVREALRQDGVLPLADLLEVSVEQWNRVLQSDPQHAALLYAQSWSVTYFLIQGEGGRYQAAFEDYLHLISEGVESREAFGRAFGADDLEAADRRWRDFARDQQPDEINQTRQRLEFLGEALSHLHREGERMPRDIRRLRRVLQDSGFMLVRQRHGLVDRIPASDDDQYVYPLPRGGQEMFELLDPDDPDLPPGVAAPHLDPAAELVWSRDAEGRLVHDVVFY